MTESRSQSTLHEASPNRPVLGTDVSLDDPDMADLTDALTEDREVGLVPPCGIFKCDVAPANE